MLEGKSRSVAVLN